MPPILPAGRYYGEPLHRLDVDGLRIVESQVAPRAVLASHGHENAYFCLVLAGSFEERSTGAARACEPSVLKFHAAGEEHSERFGPAGAHLFRLELGGAWQPWTRRLRLPGDGRAELRGVLPLAVALRDEARGDACALRMESLALELLAAALRTQSPRLAPTSCVGRARELLDATVDRRPSLAEIAAAAGVHPVHLATRFRREVGCTLGDYSRRVRIRHAQRRLAGTDLPLVEVALGAGFSDQSHFTRVFRAETGATPAAYRRRQRL